MCVFPFPFVGLCLRCHQHIHHFYSEYDDWTLHSPEVDHNSVSSASAELKTHRLRSPCFVWLSSASSWIYEGSFWDSFPSLLILKITDGMEMASWWPNRKPFFQELLCCPKLSVGPKRKNTLMYLVRSSKYEPVLSTLQYIPMRQTNIRR